jgi:hypothetical protein
MCGITLASGVAAVAASSAKSVKSCENSHGYLVSAAKKTCPHGSHQVTIAEQGPRGAPGANGISTAIAGQEHFVNEFTDDYSDVSTIADAPAGNYAVSYQIIAYPISNGVSGDYTFECVLDYADDTVLETSEVVSAPHSAVESGNDLVSLAKAGPITLTCHADGAPTISLSSAHLMAIQIDKLTTG